MGFCSLLILGGMLSYASGASQIDLESPTQAPLEACPNSCKKNWILCLKKSYQEEDCLVFAENGFLCADPKSQKYMKCSPCEAPCNFATDTCGSLCPKTASGPQMGFNTCGGCQATCENKHPICSIVCHKGCFCPQNSSVLNEVTNTCIKETQCPDANQCENAIAQNYLSTGVQASKCKNTSIGALCIAPCMAGVCQAKPAFKTGDYARFCKRLDHTDCLAPPKGNGSTGYCQWVPAGSNNTVGSTFVCESKGLDKEATWVIQEEGDCVGGNGVVDSVCEFLKETDCLDQGECTGQLLKECSVLVYTAQKQCFAECIFNSASDAKCGACLTNDLFTQKLSDSDDEPAVFKCCGCLAKIFTQNNIDEKELKEVLYAPCKQA